MSDIGKALTPTGVVLNYGKLSTLYYNLSKPFPPKVEFDFYLRELQSTKGKVLEPMCGSGRFLRPLAARGIKIEGFDKSPQMIQACTSQLFESRLVAEVFQSDFREFSPNSKYGVVLIPSGSFGLLKDAEEQIVALEKILSWLETDGLLIMEVETPAALPTSGKWQGKAYSFDEGCEITISGTCHTTRTGYRNEIIYKLLKNGEVIEEEQEVFEMNLTSQESVRRILKDIGFSRIETFPPFDPSRNVSELEPSFVVRAHG